MWGALAGAVVGASAAWLFSLDLRKRDRETTHREAMTRWLALVMDALSTYEETLRNWHPEPYAARVLRVSESDAGRARANALTAIRTALLDADGDEWAVLDAARHAVVASSENDPDWRYVSEVAVTLEGWWRRALSAEEARVTLARMTYGDSSK